MLGSVIKNFWAPREDVDPSKVFSVAIMPCTAKKFEAGRPEMSANNIPDVDAVLTTRELARFIRLRGLELDGLEPETPDNPFGLRSTAGKLFGASGGVMEAALRSAYWMITGNELEELRFRALRGMDGIKQAEVTIGDLTLKVAVVNGIGNVRKLIKDVAEGRMELHFFEVMTCPGGCIGGGGQPFGATAEELKSRMNSLYRIDNSEPLRQSHQNPWIKKLYDEFLGEPLGEKSHKLLHTKYSQREVLL